ncbi:MAG: transposase [Elusimicrobia bacterium]|nr:transposase [Elusimicrobiota bacterium]
MSLPDFSSQMDLFGLQRQLFFEKSDRYRLFFEKIYPVLAKARERLAACYCLENGRPGVEPVVLLGVSMLQFMERMPDRQAVEQFRYHVGWKYALNQELNSDVFDASVLVRFRDRLLEHEEGRLVFEVVREALEEAGLMAKRGRQRMDSTYVLGLVKRMSALDCVRESLRCGLEELSHSVEERPDFWNLLWERYVESRLDYRASEGTLREKMGQAGKDIWALLNWLDKRKGLIGEGPKCLILRRVFQEQFRVEEKEVVAERTGSGQIQNPHDPEAQYRTKQQGKRGWVGYLMQVAETVSEKPVAPGEPTANFITSIVTQTALGSDEAGMAETMEEQGQMGMEKPGELYVDGAYISGKELAIAAAENRELIGPAVAARAGKWTGGDMDRRGHVCLIDFFRSGNGTILLESN